MARPAPCIVLVIHMEEFHKGAQKLIVNTCEHHTYHSSHNIYIYIYHIYINPYINTVSTRINQDKFSSQSLRSPKPLPHPGLAQRTEGTLFTPPGLWISGPSRCRTLTARKQRKGPKQGHLLGGAEDADGFPSWIDFIMILS